MHRVRFHNLLTFCLLPALLIAALPSAAKVQGYAPSTHGKEAAIAVQVGTLNGDPLKGQGSPSLDFVEASSGDALSHFKNAAISNDQRQALFQCLSALQQSAYLLRESPELRQIGADTQLKRLGLQLQLNCFLKNSKQPPRTEQESALKDCHVQVVAFHPLSNLKPDPRQRLAVKAFRPQAPQACSQVFGHGIAAADELVYGTTPDFNSILKEIRQAGLGARPPAAGSAVQAAPTHVSTESAKKRLLEDARTGRDNPAAERPNPSNVNPL